MKEQLKKRLLDLAFLVLAAFVGIGGFYVYANVTAHRALDAAFIDLLQNSQANTQPAEVVTPE